LSVGPNNPAPVFRLAPLDAEVSQDLDDLLRRLDKNKRRAISEPMSDMTREEIDAKIAASEARGDTKFAHVDGRLDAVIGKLDDLRLQLSEVAMDNQRTRSTVVTTVVTTGIASVLGLAALIVGLALGLPSVYSLGTNTRDIVRSEVQQALPPAPAIVQPPTVQAPAAVPPAEASPTDSPAPATRPRT
jgi:predicted transcriptional regulator